MPEFKINPTDTRECDICDYECTEPVNDCRSYKTFVMCPSCLNKELEAEKVIVAGEAERVAKARAPIGSAMEYFNAKTESIIERRKQINADESISEKDLTEAQELFDWLKTSQENLISIRKQEQVLVDEMNAAQFRLNELSKNLRAEVREQFNIRNINYSPKPVSKPKAPSVKKPAKYDKVGVENAAKLAVEFKILPEMIAVSTIQTWCKAKNVTPEQALKDIAANMGKAI